MVKSDIIKNLQNRELVSHITDKKNLINKLYSESISLYCGFDPTADSLHFGHLAVLLCLKRFQLAGHRPIVVIGGATGLIGDPSFKNNERHYNTKEIIQKWIENIKNQILVFLDFNCGKNSAVIINNYDWFKSMNILEFLRNIGKYFSINQMINKESIKQRLNRHDSGISYTEFSYNLLQSYDFSFLNKNHNVVLQIGGSDQWGNIISGIDLTRRLYGNTVYGMTIPLITRSNGTKFSKTEENNIIWLDPTKTNPYNFYQFLININDKDVYKFLKIFTFLKVSDITILEKEKDNSFRAQYILAEEVTRIVHGEESLKKAQRITNILFSNKEIEKLKENDFKQLINDGISVININERIDLQEAIVKTQLATSKKQARNMISSNAITINGKKQTMPEYIFNDADKLYNRYTLICKGKKHHCLLKWM